MEFLPWAATYTVEPLLKDTSEIRTSCLIRTLDWVPTFYKCIFSPPEKKTPHQIFLVPRVSVLERFHCIYLVIIFWRTLASVDIFLPINYCWTPPTNSGRDCIDSIVGMNRSDKLTINYTCPKCIKLPTFFVCDRLTIWDLIHFSGTDSSRELVLDQCRLLLHVLLTLC